MEYFKKLNAIRDFLNAEFENSEVSAIYESDSFAQTFTISEEDKIYLVKIRRSFIDDHKGVIVKSGVCKLIQAAA
jgi:hypothetical protein